MLSENSPLLCAQALVIAGIALQAANLYGYILCKMGGESDISKVTASFLSQTVFQTAYLQRQQGLKPEVLYSNKLPGEKNSTTHKPLVIQ